MDALTKAFLEWANRKGYDTAHAYNQNESRLMFLSPMTADVYEAWQAARTVPEGYVVVPVEILQLIQCDVENSADWLSSATSALRNLLSAAPEGKK